MVEVKHISHVLVVKTSVYHQSILLVIFRAVKQFLPFIVFRKHVQSKNIHQPIIIDI